MATVDESKKRKNVDESKVRKNQVEEFDVAIGDDDVTQPEAAMSDTSASRTGLNLIMDKFIAMEQTAAKTKTEEICWRETTKTEETNWSPWRLPHCPSRSTASMKRWVRCKPMSSL